MKVDHGAILLRVKVVVFARKMRLHEFAADRRRESIGGGPARANVMAPSGAAAVFAQEFGAALGDRHAYATRRRLARDIAAIDGVLPDRQARA
jgi:hypothetical protein